MWGTTYLVQGQLPGSLDELGLPRQHSPLEIDQPAVKSAFWSPRGEGSALDVPAFTTFVLLCLRRRVLPERAPVRRTQLSGRMAWLWYQRVGIPEDVPLPHVSAQIACPAPLLPPSALCPSSSPAFALLCVSYEVPFRNPSSHLDPGEATAQAGALGFERVWTGWGALK